MPGEVHKFHHVFQSEVTSINKRRGWLNQHRASGERLPPVALEPESVLQADGTKAWRPTEESRVVGLALSGGGVRSAAVCLGAIQALEETGVLERVDYLSTVSGGGYIGCSLSAGLRETGGIFPFKSRLAEDEVPSVQHLRDYSNYLFPRGQPLALLHNIAVYLRGLGANIILVGVFLIAFSAVNIFANKNKEGLSNPTIFGLYDVPNIFPYNHFVVTSYAALLLLAAVLLWGVICSASAAGSGTEFTSRWAKGLGLSLVGVLLIAFCELQPAILLQMFELPTAREGFFGVIANTVSKWIVALTPLAAVLGFLAQKLGEFVKTSMESSRTRDQVLAYASKALIYVAALLVPLLLWALYFQISYWGLCLTTEGCANPTWLGIGIYITSKIGWSSASPFAMNPSHVAALYAAVAALLFVITLLLRPNANSLHPLYRDRLGDAFLFKPRNVLAAGEVLDLVRVKLSELSDVHAPYHLINTALNIQGSRDANRRGRNADFFILSRNFVGSKSTDYVHTAKMERAVPQLDLATAMAVSGAAASSQMGAETIKPLGPTLALLNIRLGYWLRNPLRLAEKRRLKALANYYFLFEMFGFLNEARKSVYLTDGGHIENLGLYELLKRRCKVIIVIDAEADRQMAFGSFNTLERYARIDLGTRIDLRWAQISDATKNTGEAIDKKGDAKKLCGPHCAIGEIMYPDDRRGVLIYIKASLTGDENDCIFHYKKKYSDFPHETTLDQWFSEEQFEAYRGLGFHIAYNLFDRSDAFAHATPTEYKDLYQDLHLLDEMFPRRGPKGEGRQYFTDWLAHSAMLKWRMVRVESIRW